MTVESVMAQVHLIQQVMGQVMQKDMHYGVVPGCGDKPTLLKPGAEKLCMTFRLRPLIDAAKDIEVRDIDPVGGDGGTIYGHREYRVTCHITNMAGEEIATGIGVCSTMEGKYRFRAENTNQPVPSEYWQARDKNLLGGPTFTPRKIDQKWFIFQRVEHDNPADYYNTCLKIAKKRALVDGTLSATAASDMFTQDVEDMAEVLNKNPESTAQARPEPAAPTAAHPPQQAANGAPPANGASGERVISEPQRKRLIAIALAANYDFDGIDAKLFERFQIKGTTNVPTRLYNEIVEFFSIQKKA